MKREFLLIWLGSVWFAGVMVIAFYGDFYGWHVYTWLPLLGYVGCTFGLGYYWNEARKTEKPLGEQKRWLTDMERSLLIEREVRRWRGRSG